jgi:magnesium chelatase subunit D
VVGDRAPDGPLTSIAVGATIRAAARRTAGVDARHPDQGAGPPSTGLVAPDDVREAVRLERTARLIVLAVDASGSMGAPQRMEAAKGAVLELLTDAYQRRDLVGLVSFRGDRAEVLLRPTGSVEIARARLVDLPTGGRTPLAAGIAAALELATAPARSASHLPRLVVVTDGRATAGPPGRDPLDAAGSAADNVRRAGIDALVVDVEGTGGPLGRPRLGLARQLADRMGGRHVQLAGLDSDRLSRAIRDG